MEGREVPLGSFAWASHEDPLNAYTLSAVAAGVSTRQYASTLEALPEDAEEGSVSKSAVSRRFVALSTRKLHEWLTRPLGDLDLRVVMIDGILFRDCCILVALGIEKDGSKRVLGVRHGTTENATVGRALLRDLIDRGLPGDRALLFVVDGGKGLRKAIRSTFGDLALVQRCQVHKARNVLDHLPRERHATVRRVLRQAWDLKNVDRARKQLQGLARSLATSHPSAAASVQEGLDETLTLQGLGVHGSLYRTLRTTNPIENLNGSIAHFTRNVRRWRDGKMILRWVSSAVSDAEKKFRRVRGFRDMTKLELALIEHEARHNLDDQTKVA